MPIDRRGFTLLEVLMAIAILAIIASGAALASTGSYRRASVRTESDALIALLAHARSRAMAEGGSFRVCADTGFWALYGPAGEQDMRIPSHVQTEGLGSCPDEGVSFAALSGTATPATVLLSSEAGTRRVIVNREGTIYDE